MLTTIYFRLPYHQPPNKGKAENDDDEERKQVREADNGFGDEWQITHKYLLPIFRHRESGIGSRNFVTAVRLIIELLR